MKRILIIDDEEKLSALMSRIIKLEGFEVVQAENLKSASKKLSQFDFDVVICDVKLPDGNGVEFISSIKEAQPLSEIILLTAFGNIPDSVTAIKNGAFDYIVKGDDNNKIIPMLHKAIDKVQLKKRVYQLEQQVEKKYSFEKIIGTSKAITEAINLGKKVAKTDTTVLLLGETGTGKEVFAQSIHYGGSRSHKPFVAVNCSAFSRELLESELFGHKAGAFTGAVKDKKGLLEEANTGTVFLDEIGEMAPELQAKILRVLESGEFLKVGETQPSHTDIRIIAATNRNLEDEIAKGNFRSDLFYRLSVFVISLPPLRERQKDIEILASFYAEQYALKMNKHFTGMTGEYAKALERNEWKGNVRELKNVIERSIILAENDMLDIATLPYELAHSAASGKNTLSAFAMASAEKLHIQKVLNYTKGNKAETARLLEIGIATLYRKIEEYQIH